MTFDEWWKTNGIELASIYEKSAARKGWNAAIDQAAMECEAVYRGTSTAQDCTAAIRAMKEE